MARSEVTWTSADALASADDLLSVSDMPEATVTVERWKRAIRMRGPTLPQIVAIGQQARRKDPLSGEIVRDRVQFTALTLQACIVSPRLDAAQATLLAKSKNPIILEELVDFCWNQLLQFSPDEIAQIVADVSGHAMDDEESDDASDSDRDLPV